MIAPLRWVKFAWDFEIAQYRALARFIGRRPAVAAGARPVPYVGAVSLILWTFVVLSLAELIGLHLIIPWEPVRLVADIIGIWGLVWMLGFAAANYVYPHVLSDTGLLLRTGHRDVVEIPWNRIESATARENSVDGNAFVKFVDGELLVPVGGRTTVEVVLTAPLDVSVKGRVESVHRVRFLADEPRPVAAQINEQRAPVA